MKRVLLVILACATFAACTKPSNDATPDKIQESIYRGGAPKLTLMTMINNRTGKGSHSSILVNGSQSVLFDPAGSFGHPSLAERGDVIYGMSPRWIQTYKSAHARETFHVVSHELAITSAQAEQLLQLVQARGAVSDAYCAHSISGILKQTQGFEGIKQGFYPTALMEQFQTIPNVKTTRYYENDKGDVVDGVKVTN